MSPLPQHLLFISKDRSALSFSKFVHDVYVKKQASKACETEIIDLIKLNYDCKENSDQHLKGQGHMAHLMVGVHNVMLVSAL